MVKPFIGIIGGSKVDAQIYAIAEEVGFLVASRGGTIICGGLTGVMEASCKGAKRIGGTTIGILPGFEKTAANSYIDIPIVTGLSHARNLIIVRTADVLIAIGGEHGTLSEIAFGLKLGKPIITLQSWKLDAPLISAFSSEDAVDKAWNAININITNLSND